MTASHFRQEESTGHDVVASVGGDSMINVTMYGHVQQAIALVHADGEMASMMSASIDESNRRVILPCPFLDRFA